MGASIDIAADSTRLNALIVLLGDENPEIGRTISGHIRDIGTPALSILRDAVKQSPSPLLQTRVHHLIHEMERDEVVRAIRHWGEGPAHDLESGLILIARLHTPNLSEAGCRIPLSRMAEGLMVRLDPGDGPAAMLTGMARYLFTEQGFAGNTADYYNPHNSYLHTVLETRRGIPISLSSIYLILAERLNLPMVGTGMPGHFLVKYDDGRNRFIIDPFHRGRLLEEGGCQKLLKGMGLAFDERYLDPVSTPYILQRTLKNLITLFAESGDATALDLHQCAYDALRGLA